MKKHVAICVVAAIFGGLALFAALSLTASAQTETIVHDFQSTNKHDGILPMGSLVSDPKGALYGVANQGGANGFGCVYKLTPQSGSWKQSILYSFGYSGEGEHRFRKEAERRSAAKVNSSRNESDAGKVIVE